MIRSKIRKVKIFESIEIKSDLSKIFHVPKSYFATKLQNKVFFFSKCKTEKIPFTVTKAQT